MATPIHTLAVIKDRVGDGPITVELSDQLSAKMWGVVYQSLILGRERLAVRFGVQHPVGPRDLGDVVQQCRDSDRVLVGGLYPDLLRQLARIKRARRRMPARG